MRARPFAAGRALGRGGELGLDILLDVRDARAGEEEDTEEHEGQVPGVDGVRDAGEGCCDEAAGCERLLRVCSVDQQPQGRCRDNGFHIGARWGFVGLK